MTGTVNVLIVDDEDIRVVPLTKYAKNNVLASGLKVNVDHLTYLPSDMTKYDVVFLDNDLGKNGEWILVDLLH